MTEESDQDMQHTGQSGPSRSYWRVNVIGKKVKAKKVAFPNAFLVEETRDIQITDEYNNKMNLK